MKTDHSIKQKIAAVSEIPKDVIFGIPVLTVLGEMEIDIENYSSIIEYTESLIRIRTKLGQIRVLGKKLHVEYYTNDEMKIRGEIETIEFKH